MIAGVQVVARRYARALLDVVLEKKEEPERIADELAETIEFLEEQPNLASILESKAIESAKRLAVFDKILAKSGFCDSTINVLRLLAEKERIPLLRSVQDQFRGALYEHNKLETGEVVSAHPLSESQKSKLAKHLGAARGKTMRLTYRTNAELVGGMIVRLGNRIYDASVVKQLELFKEKVESTL